MPAKIRKRILSANLSPTHFRPCRRRKAAAWPERRTGVPGARDGKFLRQGGQASGQGGAFSPRGAYAPLPEVSPSEGRRLLRREKYVRAQGGNSLYPRYRDTKKRYVLLTPSPGPAPSGSKAGRRTSRRITFILHSSRCRAHRADRHRHLRGVQGRTQSRGWCRNRGRERYAAGGGD